MARFTYTILSRAVPGQEEEFITWYRDQHFTDVLRIPGVLSGRLFELDWQRVYDLDAPQWVLMTIYELEGEDPDAIIAQLRNASGSEIMPSTDALDKSGMIQVAGHAIASSG